MKKCIILSRVSTEVQDLEQQTNVVLERCLNDGYSEENIIKIEDHESAVKLSEDERLGLNTLKTYIEHDENIDCVYAYEISRIGRRPEVNYSIRNFLQEHRVQLIILYPAIKLFRDDFSYSEADNMLFGIFNSMAENEGYIRKQRLRRGKEKSKAAGKWACGRPCIGYKRNANTGYLEVDNEEAKIVRRVYKEYSEGISSMVIGRNIVKEGLIAERNDICAKKWAIAILKNDCYVGDQLHPQIISKELKDKCNSILADFQHKPRETANNEWCLCKGLIRSLDNRYSYVCSANWGKYCLQSLRCIQIEYADRIIYNFVTELDKIHAMDSEEFKNNFIKELSSYTVKFNTSVSKRSELIKRKDDIWEKNIVGKISNERAEALNKRVEIEMDALQTELNDYANNIIRLNETLANLHDEIGNLKEVNYNELPVNEKKKLIKKYLERVRLEHVGGYVIIFHFDLIDGREIVKKYHTKRGEELPLNRI